MIYNYIEAIYFNFNAYDQIHLRDLHHLACIYFLTIRKWASIILHYKQILM